MVIPIEGIRPQPDVINRESIFDEGGKAEYPEKHPQSQIEID